MNMISLLYLDLRAKRDFRQGNVRVSQQVPELVTSTYVEEQINTYVLHRQKILDERKHSIQLPDAQHRFHSRRIAMDSGLDALDNAIESLTAAITAENIELNRKLNELDQKRKIFIRDRAHHLVQLCDNRENDVWEQYYRRVLDLYAKAIDLLGYQAQLITDTESYLSKVHARYVRRIRNYYTKLAAHYLRQDFRIPSQDDLTLLGDPNVLLPYHIQKRADIQHRRIRFQQALSDIQSRLSN